MAVTIEDMNKAYEDLGKLALIVMNENYVDLTMDQHTTENMKKFLIAVHRTGKFHAQKLKSKVEYEQTCWQDELIEELANVCKIAERAFVQRDNEEMLQAQSACTFVNIKVKGLQTQGKLILKIPEHPSLADRPELDEHKPVL